MYATSREFWQQFIPLVGGEFAAAGLRSDVVMSCHRAMAFCWREAFLQLQQYPLSLALGDIGANLRELQAKPLEDITDPTALQFREALDEGWSIAAAAEHLELLREAGASTDLVEQSHAWGRSTLLCHSELGQVQMQARSLVMQCAPAFSLCATQAQVNHFEEQIAALEAKLDKRFEGPDLFRKNFCQASVFFRFFVPFGKSLISVDLLAQTYFTMHSFLYIIVCFETASCIWVKPLRNADLNSSFLLWQDRTNILCSKLLLQNIHQAAAASLPSSQRVCGIRSSLGQWATGWAQLTDGAKANLHNEALRLKAAEDKKTQQEMSDLQDQLALYKKRLTLESMQPDVCNKVASLQHKHGHLPRFEDIYAAEQGHGSYSDFAEIFGCSPVPLSDTLRTLTVVRWR